jgi:S-adenosylmethionine decarboxylase
MLNDVERVEHFMLEAARSAEATVLKSVFHPFYPHGISGVVVIAESHLTIHSWPEYGYAALDVFTCGDEARPERACVYLAEKLKATRTSLLEIKRGEHARSPVDVLPTSTVQPLSLDAL